MWRVLARSVVGTSHRRLGTGCQDSCFVHRMSVGDEPCLVVACADGAGSASEGAAGAALACEAFCLCARDGLSTGLRIADVDQARMLCWYQQVRDNLAEEAARRALPVRELACTLLTAIVSPRAGVFAQVGDGAIVLGADHSYRVVTWPVPGEYANETTFITADAFDRAFEFVRWPGRVSELALLTDGLQRLALSYANKSVHAPFFAPMFQALLGAEDPDFLAADLERFLDSPAVNERTDDDKTLVLAIWSGFDGDAAAV